MYFRKLIVITALAMVLISGCQSVKSREAVVRDIEALDQIIKKIGPGETAAVSWIYDVENGNITALGNIWRDRVELALKDHDIRIKGRRDVGFLIDDIESFGTGRAEEKIWEKAGADILVSGNYRIISGNGESGKIVLHVKAFRIEEADLIESCEWEENLGPDWRSLESNIVGNAYHKTLQTITSPEAINKQPSLSARLNASNASYLPGEKGRIHIQTDPGAYLYLFNLSEDNTVTLLYPNKFCQNSPVAGNTFVFPEDCSEDKKLELSFYPLIPGKTCRESVIVVASAQKLDFSSIPFQSNEEYQWVAGKDIKGLYNILRQSDCWKKVSLEYTVGPECKK